MPFAWWRYGARTASKRAESVAAFCSPPACLPEWATQQIQMTERLDLRNSWRTLTTFPGYRPL